MTKNSGSRATCVSDAEQQSSETSRALKVLFVVEGFSDIRFVTGLSEICELTMVVPARQYHQSGLHQRLLMSGSNVNVDLVRGIL